MSLNKVLDEQTVQVNLPNQLGYERVAMGSVAAYAKSVGFLPERIEDLKTAVAEACINAVQHGNKGRKDARVIVTITFKEGVLGISVFDEGSGFTSPPRDPDIVRIMDNLDPPVGFGVFLMKKLMDELEFKTLPDRRNEVRMAMRLSK
ncbi:MAG: ATP-binding protein [Deltaproteobacteria bacterium]|nr:ATP-binding protein [Deltaproteobacteria bacterium]